MVTAMHVRMQLWLGFLLAALAAVGLWSSVHELARVGAAAHGHGSWYAHVSPHHLVSVIGPLAPLMLICAVACRVRGAGEAVGVRARELGLAIGGIELAEVASGSADHGWIMTVCLVFIALAASWIVGRVMVRVVQSILGRSRDSEVLRGPVEADARFVSDDSGHPSRTWLARNARRGPPRCSVA